MTGRLSGKVVLVTGTAGGQGRAAERLFAAEGATVVGCDRVAEGGHPAVDLTDEAAVADWVADAVAQHGRIDVLYANAGATRFAPITELTLDDWHWVPHPGRRSCWWARPPGSPAR